MTNSMARRAAKPIMAARPLTISALALKGPRDWDEGALLLRRGAKLAAMKSAKAATMPVGSSAICLSTLSPDASSAPMAATTPSMARRPLMTSGAGPEKAIREPKLGAAAAAAGTAMGPAAGRVPLALAASHSAGV